ncbi:unnamed protein product [Bacillus thuringiensis DB27]|uniref:Uncharacterized protein n=1 Tax=Bacillus thuringiensis DB27 TaxID=1431339 RepID=W8YD50_BACTU|nr:unnamed protein product [Bacillus thuringiensis DB27]
MDRFFLRKNTTKTVMPDCLCCVCDFASVCTYISYQNSFYHTKEKPICIECVVGTLLKKEIQPR